MIKIGGLIVSKGSEFLPEVLGLIEKRLGEIDENIQAVRQDINSMNRKFCKRAWRIAAHLRLESPGQQSVL